MNKILLLFLLPTLTFAGNIGSNWAGAGIGYLSTGYEINSVDYDFEGFSYGFGTSFNVVPLNTYGVDISLGFSQASGLEGNSNVTNLLGANADIDSSAFTMNLRPFAKLGESIVFADLGYSYAKSEVDVTGGTKTSNSSSALAFGLGAEIDLAPLTFTPSITWIFNDTDATNQFDLSEAISLAIPLDYHINEIIDISFSYNHVFYDSFNVGANSITPSSDSFLLGFKYKY